MSAVEFEVGQAGAPRLNDDPPPEGQDQVPDVGGPVVVLAWTPDEVNAAIQQWWNLGCLWFGPGWQAQARELQQSSVLLAPYFDVWFPKGSGTDPGLVMVALACTGAAFTMALSRASVIRQHWRRPWFVGQLEQLQAAQAAQAGQQPAAPAAAVPDEPTPASAPAGGPGGFKLPHDLARVVDPGGDESLASHGI